MIEKSLVLIKPDGVERGLIGEIIKRFENRGLKIIGLKMVWIDKDFAKQHYTEDIEKRHGKQVRENLIKFIVDGPVVAIAVEGVNAVENVRNTVGTTYPNEALPGTIRGDFAHVNKVYADHKKIAVKNLIHASGSKEEAEKELGLWFSMEELQKYESVHDKHVI